MNETIFASFTSEEEAHVQTIIDRAIEEYRKAGIRKSAIDIRMDLSAAHQSCPMDLAAFAAFDDYNFIHDLGGIGSHLNRITGELMDCFVPRCAR